ncbi:MAG: sterol desaturase family protein [Arenimonas sp.]
MNIDRYDLLGAWVQLGIFIGLLVVLPILEYFFSRREIENSGKRVISNIGLIVTSTVFAQLLFPLATVTLAISTKAYGFGLFQHTSWPTGIEIVLCLLILDLAIYWQHRFFHMFPWLWRMHRVHHSDLAFDATLGVRFHPFEIVLSKAYKLGWIALLGPPVLAVIIYESMLLGFSLMTHSNIRLPLKLDAMLRKVFVTPDFHRVHHSVHRMETDSNYGNILSIWDYLFRSYQAQPRAGHTDMQIGLHEFRSAAEQNIGALLIQPFRNIKRTTENEHA